MARVLAEGTGAEWAQVWLVVGDGPTLAATWPPGADARSRPEAAPRGGPEDDGRRGGRRSLPVRTAASCSARSSSRSTSTAAHVGRGTPVRRAGGPGGAGPARSPAPRRARARAGRAVHPRRGAARLAAAHGRRPGRRAPAPRARHPRRRAAAPGRAGSEPSPGPDAVAALTASAPTTLLAGQEQAAADGDRHPAQLSRGHLPAGCWRTADWPPRCGQPSTPARPGRGRAPYGVGRYAAAVEAAAYFCCLEAVQNAAKHSGATAIRIELDGRAGDAVLRRRGRRRRLRPGTTSVGTGLANMRDRIESAGGSLETGRAPGARHPGRGQAAGAAAAEQALTGGGADMRARSPGSWPASRSCSSWPTSS